MTVNLHLDAGLLEWLHDTGKVNEDQLVAVFRELAASHDAQITRDQLIRMFGAAAIYHAMTIHDPTLVQLVRDASRLLNQDLDKLSWGQDVKQWNHAAAAIVGQ